MKLKYHPSWLDYKKVQDKLTSKYLGIKFSVDYELLTGIKGEYLTISLLIPDRSYPIPVSVYFPHKVIDRNRFVCICNQLDLNIKEFDIECAYVPPKL